MAGGLVLCIVPEGARFCQCPGPRLFAPLRCAPRSSLALTAQCCSGVIPDSGEFQAPYSSCLPPSLCPSMQQPSVGFRWMAVFSKCLLTLEPKVFDEVQKSRQPSNVFMSELVECRKIIILNLNKQQNFSFLSHSERCQNTSKKNQPLAIHDPIISF